MFHKISAGSIGLLLVLAGGLHLSLALLPVRQAQAAPATSFPPTLFADTFEAAYGSSDTFVARGFKADDTITLVWDYQQPEQREVGTAVADGQGQAIFTITVPSEPNLGSVTVAALGRHGHLSATTDVLEDPAIILTPTEGAVGTSVSLVGGAFGGNEDVEVLYEGVVIGDGTTDTPGQFHLSFTVPGTIVGSTVDVQAIGQTSGVSASATFTVPAHLTITPATGPAGTVITLDGNGYAGFSIIRIFWFDPTTGISTLLASAVTSGPGILSATITAPDGLVSGQAYSVQTLDTTTSVTTQATFIAQ